MVAIDLGMFGSPANTSRRLFLQAGSLATLGLALPELLLAEESASPRAAKNCILLFGTGGPAQQETFDPKPEAGSAVRGEFRAISTTVPGLQFCELLPRMAKQAQHCAIIRSTYHESGLHGAGTNYNLTGMPNAPRKQGEPKLSRRDPPCIGSVLRQLRGDRNGLPGSVHLPNRIGDENSFQWSGQHAGFLGPQYDPLTLIDENWQPGSLPAQFLPNQQVGLERRTQRSELLQQLQRGIRQPSDDNTALYESAQARAFGVLDSKSAWNAFLLDDEEPRQIERYGDNRFGRSCLVARRLVEAGVSLVTVPWSKVTSSENFDTHKNHFGLMKERLMPVVDQAFAALLADLHDRGLLDDTLVVWTGEFGRTPKINKQAGRDHWANVYSTVLAGGGVTGGAIYGASDRNAAEPASNPVHVSDFVATIYHALGVNAETFATDITGRPRTIIAGRPIKSLF